MKVFRATTLTIAASFALPVAAQEIRLGDGGQIDAKSAAEFVARRSSYSPYAGRNFPERPLFGDTHTHTAISFDAGMVGATLMPDDAYRFAKGEEVISNTGIPVRLSRPLDFVVVSDHSDNMGFASDFISGAPNILADPDGKRWYDLAQDGRVMEAFSEVLVSLAGGGLPENLQYLPGTPGFNSAWDRIIDDAEVANDPGQFSAIIGYEWTATPNGNNLHRNIIYRDGADRARQMLPFTADTPAPDGSSDPRDLWAWMQEYEDRTGGQLLAIAHNGNVSNGTMFPLIEPDTGEEIDATYAELRTKWEPLYEVTQTKGDSEAHPALSPDDEFADYGTWDFGNMGLTATKESDMLQYEYARSGLKLGLELEEQLGTNPYQYGMVGSTDQHIGLIAVEEENFFGKATTSEPAVDRWDHVFVSNPDIGVTVLNWESLSSGYAVVWAEENTRASIFDAMERRETYATTGSRMVVRFFGGWDFSEDDIADRLVARAGYTKGVPMGGELHGAEGDAPTFIVAAVRDPIGANLDRIQIIKGWLDENGEAQEQVFDVVWGDAETRSIGADGKLPAVGNTVNVSNATWANTIGDPELIGVWTDPDFDPSQNAFYYARVLEIPTPRWTAYDAAYYGIDMSDEVPMVHQERAYTSPIWYKP